MATHYLNAPVEFDFELIGISSHVKDYRLAWAINKALRWNFVRQDDIHVSSRTGGSSHALYTHYDELEKIHWSLIENITPNGLLLPELSQWDFVVKAELPSGELDDVVVRQFRSVPFVLAVMELSTLKLKSKDNLIFA